MGRFASAGATSTDSLTLVENSQKFPLGVRLFDDTGYEEAVVHEIDAKNPNLGSSTRHRPLAFPQGVYAGVTEGGGRPLAYAVETKSSESVYSVPLLDKPIDTDDDIFHGRSSVEKILRDYALNAGIDRVDEFVNDKLNSLDGIETAEEEYPGQYL